MMKQAHLFTCKTCNRDFIVRKIQIENSSKSLNTIKSFCPECQKAFYAKRKKEKQERENLEWEKKNAENQKEYELRLSEWNVKDISDIHPTPDRTLYIIGNGFDLMHGVKSSFYAFRDSISKNSSLRSRLEAFWTPEDIWADLENGLAHFNIDMMAKRFMVDFWLDEYNAFDVDAGAAEFYAAVDSAAAPIMEVCNELPKRLRTWIETLTIGTDERPLKGLFVGGKVLDFNYTEFVEQLYSVPSDDICYIHGCRRKIKGKPKEKLIIGHSPGASDSSYDLHEKERRGKKTFHSQMVEVAQERVIDLISECDQDLTKDSSSIIMEHEDFFESLWNVTDVVIIGHSMSEVDWPYFHEVVSVVEDIGKTKWYIGCHGLNDLNNMSNLMDTLDVGKGNITVFRTDKIHVNMYPQKTIPLVKPEPVEKVLMVSHNKKWRVKYCGRRLRIEDLEQNSIVYDVSVSPDIKKVFFGDSDRDLFVVIRGEYFGVLLISLRDGRWMLIDEFVGIPNQGLLNNRLRRVFLNDKRITFVYHSRVRQYSLEDGTLIINKAVQNAELKTYDKDGKEVTEYFMR